MRSDVDNPGRALQVTNAQGKRDCDVHVFRVSLAGPVRNFRIGLADLDDLADLADLTDLVDLADHADLAFPSTRTSMLAEAVAHAGIVAHIVVNR